MRIEAFTTYMPVGMSFCVEKPQRQTFGHRFAPDHKKSLRLKGVLTKYKIKPQQLEENFLAKHLPRVFISKSGSKKVLQKIAAENPDIKLARSRFSKTIFPENISSEIYGHFIPTRNIALKLMQASSESYTKIDFLTMQKAALLHDLGKAYIPEQIINKAGKLTPEERQIVDEHARIGYEILKALGFKGKILELVKMHHTYSNINPPTTQILQIADIWSALKEKRSYKKAFDNDIALEILLQKMQNGDFDKKYIELLEKIIRSEGK